MKSGLSSRYRGSKVYGNLFFKIARNLSQSMSVSEIIMADMEWRNHCAVVLLDCCSRDRAGAETSIPPHSSTSKASEISQLGASERRSVPPSTSSAKYKRCPSVVYGHCYAFRRLCCSFCTLVVSHTAGGMHLPEFFLRIVETWLRIQTRGQNGLFVFLMRMRKGPRRAAQSAT